MTETGLIHAHCAEERRKQWQLDNKETGIVIGDFCQIQFDQIIDGLLESEHMWVHVAVVDNNKQEYTGLLDNDPTFITNVKCGDTITFKKEKIEQHLK